MWPEGALHSSPSTGRAQLRGRVTEQKPRGGSTMTHIPGGTHVLRGQDQDQTESGPEVNRVRTRPGQDQDQTRPGPDRVSTRTRPGQDLDQTGSGPGPDRTRTWTRPGHWE
ncbi:hypothetical protein EYF80_063177 [Liparis tanakae]|uniref:Uncharacterized protein n=1 Tax=Liparis tanakae TaxID=230148 RepID=A0A4Z2ECQ4_9TELE|nr:hypothetical protein EYF80_063177 [Liparis tanakae]